MELSALAGNARLKEQLAQRVAGRGLNHAYILAGPAGSGRHTLARILSQAMVCTDTGTRCPCGTCAQCRKAAAGTHPDVISVAGPDEGKPITVDQIRAVRSDAHIRPNEGARKVYLLENAGQMNASAQNAMLKLLEEGPAYAAFLLFAENPGGLLETVRSRCEELELTPVPQNECAVWLKDRFPDKPEGALRAAAMNCQGILGRAVEELNGGEDRAARLNQARELADALEKGSELRLFEATTLLEQVKKPELVPLLDAVTEELTRRMVRGTDRKRLLRAVDLVRELRAGALVNANPGQLAGWLCAGIFVNAGNGGGEENPRPNPWK